MLNSANPILFALASLLCAGISDVVYRQYARQQNGVGTYVAVIGLVWVMTFSGLAYPADLLHTTKVTLGWGVLSGAFGAAANILFIEAMARSEAGICSTIYRLNLAPAALFAIVVLGEKATTWKSFGIGAALASVLLFFDPTPQDRPHKNSGGLWFVMGASLLRAAMGVSYKCGLSSGADGKLLLGVNGLMWLAAGLAYCVFVERGHTKPKPKTWGYGLLSGVLTTGIVLFLMLALKNGDASTVLPITQLSFMVTCVFGMLFLEEQLTIRKAIGLSFAVGCIVLMTVRP